MPATAHIDSVFKPATDRFGDFTIAQTPVAVISPEAQAKDAANKHFLIGVGFVAGLIAFFGALSVIDQAVFPEPQLTAQEYSYFASYD